MAFQLVKILLTSIIIVSISWLSKKYSLMSALLASLPLTSILAFIWIYLESGDVERILDMSRDIIWLVLPSLVFFLLLPVFVKRFSLKFPEALCLSAVCCSLIYVIFYQALKSVK